MVLFERNETVSNSGELNNTVLTLRRRRPANTNSIPSSNPMNLNSITSNP